MAQSNAAGSSCCCLFICALITAIVLVAVSLKKISSTEVGLQYDRVAKTLSGKIVGPGLHAGPPGFKFVKVTPLVALVLLFNIVLLFCLTPKLTNKC
jgi:hypothetical protein